MPIVKVGINSEHYALCLSCKLASLQWLILVSKSKLSLFKTHDKSISKCNSLLSNRLTSNLALNCQLAVDV